MVEELAPETTEDLAALPWRPFLERFFPHYVTAPFANRHIRFWEWASSLRLGVKPRARVEVWPRGGGKSSTIELGCAFLGHGPRPRRHYVLYVSETQAQADKHVQSVAAMLERVGLKRAVNEYGQSKGWKHQEIRAANGFNVTAFGLDAGMRGARLDEYRPDVIVFDDIDGRHDTAATVQKKIDIITETVLPAGSTDCAVIIVQNKIHKNSIVSQLCDGRADFLHNREPAVVEPAVVGLGYQRVPDPDGPEGTTKYVITDGRPTWAGQGLATCEAQLNEWGVTAFRREAQHEVAQTAGAPFQAEWFGAITPGEHYLEIMQVWDTAFKELKPEKQKKGKKPDYSVCLTIGISLTGYDVLDMWRDRVAYPDLERAAQDQATWATYRWAGVPLSVLIEDKASGQSLIQTMQRLTRFNVIAITPRNTPDRKMQDAESITPVAEARRIRLPITAPWRADFLREVTEFPDADHDDIVDTLTMGVRRAERLDTDGGAPVRRRSYTKQQDTRTGRRRKPARR